MELSFRMKQDDKTKEMKGMPPSIEQDVYQSYYPFNPINQKLLSDNVFYRAVDSMVVGSTVSYMPYLCSNTVFHSSDNHQQDISKYFIKSSSPYNLKEGIVCACRQMYKTCGIQPQHGSYRFYTQAYYIYTALCVGVDNNGNISLLTANKEMLELLPVYPYSEGTADNIMSMTTDDVTNGIVQCVELTPNAVGYTIRPAVIYANKKNYVIAPKAWLDYLIDSINSLLVQSPCRVSYIDQGGKVDSVIACNSPKGMDNLHNQIDDSCKYGVIKCIDIIHNNVVSFPITHFISLEPCEGV